jgi:signal peptidase I
LKEIIKFTIIALVIVVPVRTYIAQPFIVSGASMDPTFKNAEYLIVDELTYRFREPERGEVIIFRFPQHPETFFIKRIIGLPGDTVISREGKITILNDQNPNGLLLDDSYLIPKHRTKENFSTKLQNTEYFVMGDNRPESSDSRFWGPLERKYIVGRPFVRLFPFNKISVFPGVE